MQKVLTLPGRERLLLIFCSVHIIFVAFGAAHLFYSDYQNRPVLSIVAAHYYELTGAANTFGFFAPGVSPDTRVILRIHEDGEWRVYDTSSGLSSEQRLRLSTINGLMLREEFEAYIGAAWASLAFGTRKNSVAVLVDFQFFSLEPLGSEHPNNSSWKRIKTLNYLHKERLSALNASRNEGDEILLNE